METAALLIRDDPDSLGASMRFVMFAVSEAAKMVPVFALMQLGYLLLLAQEMFEKLS